jgi:hypothetical protein
MQRLLEVMKGQEFQKAVAALPGYRTANTGSVSTVKEFLESVDVAPVATNRKKEK